MALGHLRPTSLSHLSALTARPLQIGPFVDQPRRAMRGKSNWEITNRNNKYIYATSGVAAIDSPASAFLYTLSTATRACHCPYHRAARRYTGRRGKSITETGRNAMSRTVGSRMANGLTRRKYTTAEYE